MYAIVGTALNLLTWKKDSAYDHR